MASRLFCGKERLCNAETFFLTKRSIYLKNTFLRRSNVYPKWFCSFANNSDVVTVSNFLTIFSAFQNLDLSFIHVHVLLNRHQSKFQILLDRSDYCEKQINSDKFRGNKPEKCQKFDGDESNENAKIEYNTSKRVSSNESNDFEANDQKNVSEKNCTYLESVNCNLNFMISYLSEHLSKNSLVDLLIRDPNVFIEGNVKFLEKQMAELRSEGVPEDELANLLVSEPPIEYIDPEVKRTQETSDDMPNDISNEKISKSFDKRSSPIHRFKVFSTPNETSLIRGDVIDLEKTNLENVSDQIIGSSNTIISDNKTHHSSTKRNGSVINDTSKNFADGNLGNSAALSKIQNNEISIISLNTNSEDKRESRQRSRSLQKNASKEKVAGDSPLRNNYLEINKKDRKPSQVFLSSNKYPNSNLSDQSKNPLFLIHPPTHFFGSYDVEDIFKNNEEKLRCVNTQKRLILDLRNSVNFFNQTDSKRVHRICITAMRKIVTFPYPVYAVVNEKLVGYTGLLVAMCDHGFTEANDKSMRLGFVEIDADMVRLLNVKFSYGDILKLINDNYLNGIDFLQHSKSGEGLDRARSELTNKVVTDRLCSFKAALSSILN